MESCDINLSFQLAKNIAFLDILKCIQLVQHMFIESLVCIKKTILDALKMHILLGDDFSFWGSKFRTLDNLDSNNELKICCDVL